GRKQSGGSGLPGVDEAPSSRRRWGICTDETWGWHVYLRRSWPLYRAWHSDKDRNSRVRTLSCLCRLAMTASTRAVFTCLVNSSCLNRLIRSGPSRLHLAASRNSRAEPPAFPASPACLLAITLSDWMPTTYRARKPFSLDSRSESAGGLKTA